MSMNRKILTAITSALNYLESSMGALSNKDEDSFAKGVWHVVAELEYALFLFSIVLQNSVAPKPKADPNLKNAEVNQIIADANQFLKDAETLVKDGKLLEAHENVRSARNYILKVQEALSKRKREASKNR
jgi:tRNA G37 N-methylase Trm5